MNFLILLLLSVFWGSNSFAENKKLPRTLQPIVLDSLKIRNDAKMNRMDLSELVEKWSFIRLEAAGIACAGEIRLVNVIDDYVLLEDIKDGKVRILLYSISGKFIAQIGEQGEGQGMYQYATAYTLNPFTKQVLVLDGKRNLRHVYNFEGKHLESGDLPEFSFMISDIRFVNKDVLLGSNKVMLDNPIAYFMTDIKFSQQQLVAPLNVTWSAGAISFASQAFSVFKGDISLLRPFCDTIFGYSENRLYPKVVLQTKNSVPRGYA
ncbi:MAG: 6-bladed beta-propeller, partial [Odoribacter sp.]